MSKKKDKEVSPAAKKNRRRIIIATMAVMLALLSTLAAAINYILGTIVVTDPGQWTTGQAFVDTEEEEDPNFEAVYDITDATSLKGFVHDWWYNGGDDMIRYSKDVVNVLLMGIDDDENAPGQGRSDTMLLVSVNKKTKVITMLSFLRDSYCYMNINGEEWYHRLNTSYHIGGPQGVMEAISRLYKIRVDNYVTVDFKSFTKVIDAFGGIAVDVTEAEARYINRTAPTQRPNKFPAGEGVTLTGQQALIYARIRKLDTDMARTGRQQKIIASLISEAKGASFGELYNAMEVALPYVKTNFTKGEIITMLPSAMGWLGYDMVRMYAPALEGSEATAIGAKINGMDIWVVDYPRAAQQVQLALYGETNINLEDGTQRDAYINSLFNSVGEHRSTQPNTTQPQSGTSGEDWTGEDEYEPTEDYDDYTGEESTTEPSDETTEGSRWPQIIFPWDKKDETTAPPETEPLPEDPPLE